MDLPPSEMNKRFERMERVVPERVERIAAEASQLQEELTQLTAELKNAGYGYSRSGGSCEAIARMEGVGWDEIKEGFFLVLGAPLRCQILYYYTFWPALSIPDLEDLFMQDGIKCSQIGLRKAVDELEKHGYLEEAPRKGGKEKYYQTVGANPFVIIFNHITFNISSPRESGF